MEEKRQDGERIVKDMQYGVYVALQLPRAAMSPAVLRAAA